MIGSSTFQIASESEGLAGRTVMMAQCIQHRFQSLTRVIRSNIILCAKDIGRSGEDCREMLDLFLLCAATLCAETDPFIGKWEIDRKTSQFETQYEVIEALGNNRFQISEGP